MVRWIYALVAIAIVAALVAAQADELPSTMPDRPTLHKLFVFGSGIAANPSDVLDFKVVRIGMGKVIVPPRLLRANDTNSTDFETNCTANGGERCFPMRRAGILFLDKEKYSLREISMSNESASANIYRNDSQIGTIALTRVPKPGQDVWAGTLTVNGATYHAYVIGAGHRLKAAGELAGEIKKRCGPKLPEVNATEVRRCRQEGGRIVIERDSDGCPLAPRCVKGECREFVTPPALEAACQRRGGQMMGGTDDSGCPVRPRCVLPSGEAVNETGG